MTIERALEDITSLLGGVDSDTEDKILDILNQLYDDAHEDGFTSGEAAGLDYYEDDGDDFEFADEEEN